MKQKRMPRRNCRRFIIGWVLVWYLALFLLAVIISVSPPFSFSVSVFVLAYFALLAIFQVILVRRYLHTELSHWVTFALLGVIVGQIGLHFFEANVEYALHNIAYDFLNWSVPLVFQWLALRKRFRHHGLWLLAAVISAPFGFAVLEHGSIFSQVVDLLEHLTGLSLAYPLGMIALFLDWTILIVIMGLVLQYIVVKNKSSQLSA